MGNADITGQHLELEELAALPGQASVLWPLKGVGELRLSCGCLGRERKMNQLGEIRRTRGQVYLELSVNLLLLGANERREDEVSRYFKSKTKKKVSPLITADEMGNKRVTSCS